MKKLSKYFWVGLSLQALPLVAFAQARRGFTIDTILSILGRILNWFTAIVGILAILVMLYAAFLYMTAAGDEEKVGKAKRNLIYALVGIGIAVLAYFAIGFIEDIVGVRSGF